LPMVLTHFPRVIGKPRSPMPPTISLGCKTAYTHLTGVGV
jgi:hypothetical protein